MDKQTVKHAAKKCHFCPTDIYELLEVHRIKPGEAGGQYEDSNIVVACRNCHRRIHVKDILIDQWYPTTAGIKVLHYFENNVEHWD